MSTHNTIFTILDGCPDAVGENYAINDTFWGSGRNIPGGLGKYHRPLARYVKLRVRMRRECRERLPRHCR